MLYLAYCEDHPGTDALRDELIEAHWSYMDGFTLIARGPTLSDDGELATGSLHVPDLASDEAARAFVTDEPNWQGGVYARALLFRFEDRLGRTMWDFPGPDGPRFLVLALGGGRTGTPASASLILYGRLLTLGTDEFAGTAACVQAADATAALAELPPSALDGADVTVHPWQFGGRR
jgi:uncharacterized protein YciI